MIAEQAGAADRGSGGLSIELRAGLSALEVDRRIAQAHRAGDIGARALAFYLVDLAERGAHQELGFHSIEQYAETRHHIAPATTRCYLATGRALRELPAIDDAFCEGRLFWSQVRELVRLATPQTEVEWVRWAQSRTAREIAAAARIRQKGERPTDPARRRIHEITFSFQTRMRALDWTRWNTAREKLEAEFGRPVSDIELMREAATLILTTRPDGSVPGRMPVNDSHYQVVAIRDRATGEVTIDADGVPVPIDPAELSENAGPDVSPDDRDIPTPPALRRAVLERDRLRCLSCGSRNNLTEHHKHWRRKGGRTEEGNLGTECEPCHSLIHGGFLRMAGKVPGNLRFVDARGHDLKALTPRGRVTVESMVIRKAPPAPPSDPGEVVSRETNSTSPRDVVSRETSTPSLEEFVGQEPVVAALKRAAARARLRNEPMPHVLLCGAPGLGKSSLAIDDDAARLLAGASRDTPREALSLLCSVRDEAELRGASCIGAGIARRVLESLAIDAWGLGRVERAYLEALCEAGRPLSLGTLADRLGKSPGALLRVHEPFLIRRGLIVRTINGRALTAAGAGPR